MARAYDAHCRAQAKSEALRDVAPTAPRVALKDLAGRLLPLVTIESARHAVLVPALTAVRRRDLGSCLTSLAESHQDLLAALDLLFFGV